ncbi:MAG TPA: leucyl aminopeptidase family protein [Hyphomicrobiaceae bacterium]|nr:leucyl aminopeptidase family protein [Hyphomicrobiaceae bacterium]
MTARKTTAHAFGPADVLLADSSPRAATPVWLVSDAEPLTAKTTLGEAERRWLEAVAFTSAAKKQALVPRPDGTLAGVALGLGNGAAGEPSGPSQLLVGQLAASLPPGVYRLEDDCRESELAALAWGLGAYRFRRYKAAHGDEPPQLKVPAGLDRSQLLNVVEAVWLGRDLINTPASEMGPEDLEAAARKLALRHGAKVSAVAGDKLLQQNFPMIHAVGRASSRAPRLIDLKWQKKPGRKSAPAVTLIGKGISFDSGGLDIKPASAMALMKKDMGGAATALALGHMIMGQGLDVRLRILIPAAENSISGDAFRPGDVLRSRAGATVEIGNTDAEGRLVLADALALADADKPEMILIFATLTGAARVALGPDVPALFTDDDAFAADLVRAGAAVGDPVWRLPLWPGYERNLDSDVADMNNVWEAPFAGAITAALFLKRFVKTAKRFVHIDLYAWRPAARPLGPKGGEPQTARAVFSMLKREYGQ